ncbi:MAG: DNA-binding FrmR family transcriptional regulator [Myxococcota bacterium]|jgi:DNA-binding FrmR family transcriptional regulator
MGSWFGRRMSMMGPETKEKVEARLKRVAGQVAGIQRMVDGDRYCVDVLVQISAARAALAKVSNMMLETHIQTCVTHAFESDDPAQRKAKTDELIRVFDKHCGR